MRIWGISMLSFVLMSLPGMGMEQKWIDDLNRRFPGIGYEFQEAVQQKLAQHGDSMSVEAVIEKLLSDPDYQSGKITNAKTFGVHSELMLLYPAVGKYQEALREAKLLRDFALKHSSDDLKLVQTFRGVYTELLIINEQYDQALEEVKHLFGVNPDEKGNYLSRGVISVKLGQLDNALEDLKKLIKKPEAGEYAKQLFVFIMQNREMFQEAQVQENTMIDVMLKALEPEPQSKIRIPANVDDDKEPVEAARAESLPASAETPQETVTPPVKSEEVPSSSPEDKTSEHGTDSITELVTLDEKGISQVLGPPILESEGELTFDRDYHYGGQTLTIGFDKSTGKVVSLQMFFLPPVDEATALSRIGLIYQDITPSINSSMLKVWTPYDKFAKVRLSLSEGQVIAIIVEP